MIEPDWSLWGRATSFWGSSNGSCQLFPYPFRSGGSKPFQWELWTNLRTDRGKILELGSLKTALFNHPSSVVKAPPNVRCQCGMPTAASQDVANGAGQLKHGAKSSRLRVTEAIDLKVHGGIVEGVPHGEFLFGSNFRKSCSGQDGCRRKETEWFSERNQSNVEVSG